MTTLRKLSIAALFIATLSGCTQQKVATSPPRTPVSPPPAANREQKNPAPSPEVKSTTPPSESKPNPKSKSAAPEAKWIDCSNKSSGISVLVPADWHTFDFSSKDIKTQIQDFVQGNAFFLGLAPKIQAMSTAGYQFFAVGPTALEGTAPYSPFIDLSFDPDVKEPLAKILDKNMPGLEANAANGTKVERVEANLGALRGEKISVIGNPEKTGSSVAQVIYFAVKGKTLYVLTCATAPSSLNKMKPVFERIAASFTAP